MKGYRILVFSQLKGRMEMKLTARQSISSFNTNHLGSDLQTTPAVTLHRLLIYGAWQTAQVTTRSAAAR